MVGLVTIGESNCVTCGAKASENCDSCSAGLCEECSIWTLSGTFCSVECEEQF